MQARVIRGSSNFLNRIQYVIQIIDTGREVYDVEENLLRMLPVLPVQSEFQVGQRVIYNTTPQNRQRDEQVTIEAIDGPNHYVVIGPRPRERRTVHRVSLSVLPAPPAPAPVPPVQRRQFRIGQKINFNNPRGINLGGTIMAIHGDQYEVGVEGERERYLLREEQLRTLCPGNLIQFTESAAGDRLSGRIVTPIQGSSTGYRVYVTGRSQNSRRRANEYYTIDEFLNGITFTPGTLQVCQTEEDVRRDIEMHEQNERDDDYNEEQYEGDEEREWLNAPQLFEIGDRIRFHGRNGDVYGTIRRFSRNGNTMVIDDEYPDGDGFVLHGDEDGLQFQRTNPLEEGDFVAFISNRGIRQEGSIDYFTDDGRIVVRFGRGRGQESAPLYENQIELIERAGRGGSKKRKTRKNNTKVSKRKTIKNKKG